MTRGFVFVLCVLVSGWSGWGQTTPAIAGVVNAASGQSAIESGSLASIYGTGLAATTHTLQSSDYSGTSLPTTLASVSVLIDGKPAALLYVSPTQINVQVPADTATGSVVVQVKGPNGTATGTATLASYAPGIFILPGGFAAAVHNSNGTIAVPAGTLANVSNTSAAVPGETLQVYATGLGPTPSRENRGKDHERVRSPQAFAGLESAGDRRSGGDRRGDRTSVRRGRRARVRLRH